MKHIVSTFLLLTCLPMAAQATPNFREIFRMLENTNSITEAMEIRERSLAEIQTLQEFDKLTNFEKLAPGESYFTSYKYRMADFIAGNIQGFINPDKKAEASIFVTNIYPKVKDTPHRLSVAEMGLSYVKGCDEFKSYAAKTAPELAKKHLREYCHKGGSKTGKLISVLIHPRTLEEGRWDTVNFNDYVYVKKIYLSAEGVGRDAYFDIMVNGDIKGTVYAPGRDPSYVITVEDYADSILLRSLQGNARISSIVLEVQ